MDWSDIHNVNDPEVDRLGERYHLHSLHLAQAKAPAPRGIDEGPGYLFIALDTLSIFAGRDFLITIRNGDAPLPVNARLRPDEALLHILESAGQPEEILPVAQYLQTADNGLIGREMRPFFRDLHRRLARRIEESNRQRERAAGRLAADTNRLLKVLVALAAFIAILLLVMLYRWGA